MNGGRAVLAMLFTSALGLTGVLAWELRPASRIPPVPLPAAVTPSGPAVAAPPAPAADHGAEWAAMLLARPAFSPDRRPPAPALAPMAAAGAETPPPRLTGILITAAGRSAIFADPVHPLVVREGGILGHFAVQRIEPGQVTLIGPGGPQIIRPAFDTTRPRPGEQGTGLFAPGVPAAPGTPAALTLPGLNPVTGGDPPPVPGTFPSPVDGAQGAMQFRSLRAPSGLDILRNQASPARGGLR